MEQRFKRRDAVVAGLSAVLSDDQITEALAALDETLFDAPAFNLQRFADTLHDRLAPRCGRRELYRALVKSVFLGGNGQESTREAIGEPGEAPPSVTRASPENRVFEHLLVRFLALVATQRRAAEPAVRSYLIDKLGALDLPLGTQYALTEWLAWRQPAIHAPLTLKGMRNLLNLSYILACEYLGPVVADRLLSQAVKESEALPEAKTLPPRTLL